MVRLHPPTTVLCILAAGLAGAATLRFDERPADNVSLTPEHCRVVAAAIDDYLAGDRSDLTKPIVLSASPEPVVFGSRTLTELLADPKVDRKVKENPLVPLQLGLEALDGENVITHCPALITELERRVGLKVRAEGERLPIGTDGQYSSTSLSISMPFISADRRKALIHMGTVSGPEAGAGQEIYLQKNSYNDWYVVFSDPTWIS